MLIDPDHPALRGGATAAAVAIALADAWQPDGGLTVSGGLELDVARVRQLTQVGSTGERMVAAIVLSLYGEQPVDLSRLDALDRPTRRLVADAVTLFAG